MGRQLPAGYEQPGGAGYGRWDYQSGRILWELYALLEIEYSFSLCIALIMMILFELHKINSLFLIGRILIYGRAIMAMEAGITGKVILISEKVFFL